MRFLFAFLIIIHGIIHLMGFAKAFKFADIPQLSQSISKPLGLLWLFASALFLMAVFLYLQKREWWFVLAFVSVIISQILIVLYWKDAKFGTIANVIILIVSVSAFGNYQFSKMVHRESKQLLQNVHIENLPEITEQDVGHIPKIVQKWMQNSGVIGKEKIVSVRLKQRGNMKTKPNSKWMSFDANQYFNVENPAFVWSTEVDFMPIIMMVGRDKLIDGEGTMLIKLAGLIPVVNESDNEKINQGALIRFLAEICWFPSAALNAHISWESIDETSAKATLTIGEKQVTGIFKFNTKGDVLSFEADRYFGGTKTSQLERWVIDMNDYKVFEGIKIPNKCSVTWKLAEGDFNWLNLEITSLEFNIKNLFNEK